MNKQIILAVLMGMTTWQVGANIITDGSFESLTSQISGSFTTIPATSSSTPLGTGGWVLTSGSVDAISSYWPASNGSVSLDLQGNPGEHATISQTFNTVLGQKYTLSFDVSGNPDGGGTKSLSVNVGASAFTLDFAANTHANMGWTRQTFQFQGTGNPTTLSFTDTSANISGYGIALDNVSVVPEASTWLAGLGATGMLLVGMRMHARRSGVVRLN